MKLFRWGEPSNEKPGLQWQGADVDASDFGEDYDEQFFATDGLERLLDWAHQKKSTLRPVGPVRWAACVARPSKLVCVGLNYRDHAQESHMDLPGEPVLFLKATSAICGPFDELILPSLSVKTDWEVELALVIGKKAKHVDEAQAMDYVAGYCLHNDYSEREFQLERGGQWVKGKSCDTFGPLGPYFVTKDQIPNPQALNLWLTVNGTTMQRSSTDLMVFQVPFLVSYISRFMTLLPGDIVSTGTPAGVGLGLHPPQYLKRGDRVELGIDGLGIQRQRVV